MAKQNSTVKPASQETVKPAVPKLPADWMKRRGVDSIDICLAALEEIRDLTESLQASVDMFKETPDSGAWKAGCIIAPAVAKLGAIVQNEFPDLARIREILIECGYGNQILGG